MKIIGAGFGRTGTTSIKAALKQLGFAPVYHMEEVVFHFSHQKKWIEAANGIMPDWRQFFSKYESVVDFPACIFYKEIFAAFPDAKVLLSVRDPDSWYESTHETIYNSTRVPVWLRRLLPPARAMYEMGYAAIWDGIFHGRFEDRAYAIARYNHHNEEVKAKIPPEKLLVFNVKEGWGPVCRFLDVPVPDSPFPHLNDRARMEKMVRVLNFLNKFG